MSGLDNYRSFLEKCGCLLRRLLQYAAHTQIIFLKLPYLLPINIEAHICVLNMEIAVLSIRAQAK